jgi:hypothetical protein
MWQDFANAHGPYIFTRGRYLFADGATCDKDCVLFGNPPTDERSRLTLIMEYIHARMATERSQLDAYILHNQQLDERRRMYSSPRTPLPGPPADAPAKVAEGERLLADLQSQLTDTQARLDQLPRPTFSPGMSGRCGIAPEVVEMLNNALGAPRQCPME